MSETTRDPESTPGPRVDDDTVLPPDEEATPDTSVDISVEEVTDLPQGKMLEVDDVTLRFATPDVIHGILVTGTNVNTMIVPGYVAQVHTRFTKTGDLLMPCDEYCGLGHTQMIATVKVVPPEQFRPDAQGRAACGDDR